MNVFRIVRTLAMLRPVDVEFVVMLVDLLPETHLIVIINGRLLPRPPNKLPGELLNTIIKSGRYA